MSKELHLCTCGRPTYQPWPVTTRRPARRCPGCHFTPAWCRCPVKRLSRHEYRLVWTREGNTQPRSKRFWNMKRLNGYLRALTASTAEERYGDKVDKQWCCSGSSGDGYSEPHETCYRNCEGKTWREKFEDSREMWKEIPPLTEVRIESRELPAWNTETTMANDEEFKFGDIIRLSDAYIESVPTAFKGVRLMVVVAKTGLIVERGGHYESPVGDLRPYERTVWTKVDD